MNPRMIAAWVLLLAGLLVLPACGSTSAGWQSHRYRQYVRKMSRQAGRQQQSIQRERARIPDAQPVSDQWNVSAEVGAVGSP